jgi:hypothetical protein
MSQVERELLPGEGDPTLAGIAAILEPRSTDQTGLPHVLAATVEYLNSEQVVSNPPENLYACAVEQTRTRVVVAQHHANCTHLEA